MTHTKSVCHGGCGTAMENEGAWCSECYFAMLREREQARQQRFRTPFLLLCIGVILGAVVYLLSQGDGLYAGGLIVLLAVCMLWASSK